LDFIKIVPTIPNVPQLNPFDNSNINSPYGLYNDSSESFWGWNASTPHTDIGVLSSNFSNSNGYNFLLQQSNLHLDSRFLYETLQNQSMLIPLRSDFSYESSNSENSENSKDYSSENSNNTEHEEI
jgi:hypothetical protein